MTFDTLKNFLVGFVLTPGGAGAILYFFLDKTPYVDAWFDRLSAAAKRLTVLGLSLLIPSMAMGLSVWLDYVPFSEDAVFAALQVGFAVFTGSQVAHGLMGLRKR